MLQNSLKYLNRCNSRQDSAYTGHPVSNLFEINLVRLPRVKVLLPPTPRTPHKRMLKLKTYKVQYKTRDFHPD